MKKNCLLILSLLFVCLISNAQQLAFPGAEGFGKYAKGARASASPAVYHVTNLNDSGTGSLRDAVSASNRIVVFDVAGVIKITSRIVVSSNIYIAGQSAPGEGITVYGNGFSFSGANNVICRYLRMRMGATGDSGKDACGIADGDNMMFDHVSVSWGRDETFSINGAVTNVTIQNSIISQGLLSHSAGGLIQPTGGVTLYRNLYADNDTRNNKIKGINQYVNNIVYNWSSGAYLMGGESEGQSYANCVSNYFINGPEKSVNALSGANSNYHIFAADNWWDKNRDGVLNGYLVPQSEYSGGPDFQSSPYDYPVVPTWSAQSLVDSLLPAVGASLPYRDLLDCYVTDQVRSFGKKGVIITNETENPIGVPTAWTMWTGTKRQDTDNDGIPDAWETANGLNAALSTDAVALSANGYLNIENYLNGIGKSYSQDFLRAPLCLIADSASQNTLYLSWFDFTEKEQGYVVERKIKGTYTEIARTAINGNTFTLKGLLPEEKDTFRVRAYNASGYSAYSNELAAKTSPIPVPVLDLATFTPNLIWSGNSGNTWDKLSANWTNNNEIKSFADSATVLFGNTGAGSIAINEVVGVKAMVVNADSSYTFTGSGNIGGPGSLNKAGVGSLTLQTNNTYQGATVLYNGILNAATITNGGSPSSIGASKNYDFNLVLKGGILNYTGATTTTDRGIRLEGNAAIGVSNSTAVLTSTGLISGTGGLTKTGAGSLVLKGLNDYQGITSVNQGTLEIGGSTAIINSAFTADKSYVLSGGSLKTSGGSTTVYENYYSSITLPVGTTSSFTPYRNCYIYSRFVGGGNLNFNITYLREYIQGDWSQFSGTLYANGTNSTDGSQFMLNNTDGIPNARVVTSGNTKIICWKNASTMYLGGLSGPAGTYLSGADKQNNAAAMLWIVGGAGTDETFNGIINNECSNASYKGVTTIVKEGKGYWRLSGANVYAGTTTVRGGALIVNGAQTGTGKVTVNADATLAGKGTLPGAVEIQTGATLAAGDPYATALAFNIGTLTVGSLTLQSGSNVVMDLNKAGNTADKVVSAGAVVFGGTLNIKVLGTLVAGDQFTLFTGTSYSGAFENIVPATPGAGLVWSFVNGVLKVEAASAIEEVQGSQVRLFPNPAVNETELLLDKVYAHCQLTIESLNGIMLMKRNIGQTDRIHINLSQLPVGACLVRVKTSDHHTIVRRLIKQ